MDINENSQLYTPNTSTNPCNWVYFNQMPFLTHPYGQFFQFCQFQQMDHKKQEEKSLIDAAVQTQKLSELLEESSQIQPMKFEEEQAMLKQFPLPNKEKLFQLFQCTSIRRRQINNILNEICTQKTKPLNNFYRSVGEKIMNFKKTKEEIIKFLVRRAWRKQDKDLDMAREKYYSKYKSMNTEYLSMIFNDSSFVNAYQEMMEKFDEQFDSFNQERFQRFYDYLLNCYVKNNLLAFKNSKQCKSKLPYPLIWKAHIFQIAQSLYEMYFIKKSQKKKNFNEQVENVNEKEKSE